MIQIYEAANQAYEKNGDAAPFIMYGVRSPEGDLGDVPAEPL